ncbi:SubName: Full=Uncharacterized protein {ECO:0000313/EMBL:CCA68519.1} [Serendipita indica DSM 11827]|uniref:THO1-MOS11 C-terminal domain-containing protein n=1 Tax=Serendipita indica (strain DSM 11827) TaxID=1109443 RepID=G4TB10_SERID|nr:SubName: Full=Uncharacterized protein {ECO:0000313/EMBL:CCA68519.1} [Serendipita indica DSM 11827]CCA68519.1 hypothetical protein PIIN_02383 [Serendipita indica DSM 11827]
MDAKLKAMKVADLKSILQQANVSFDAKLTKPALIKKILETPEALAAASAGEENADDDLPDLPPAALYEAPKATTDPSPAPTKAPPPTPAAGLAKASPAAPGPSKAAETSTAAFKAADVVPATLEDEAAKRRARAAKWGTTFVDPTAPPPAPAPAPSKPAKAAKAQATIDDEEKIKARQAKFGTSSAGKKAEAPVDEEELRKRKLREERFGANKKPRIE